LKLLQGNRENRPIKDEPKPTPELPEPSKELSEDARLEFMRLREEAYNCGLMTRVDVRVFEAYCTAYGRWVVAERDLARMAAQDPLTHGVMIRTKEGNAIHNPLVSIANKAMRDMVSYAVELGFTPSARARVAAGAVPPKQASKFEGLIA
jgi:P27 family predicted phage terminase small subunit